MFRIFKEFESLQNTYGGDVYALSLNVIGGLLIAVTFIGIGAICLALARFRDGATRKSVIITKMFGLFLMSCGFARVVSVLCTWHNLALLDGWMKILTGSLALIALLYLPSVIRESLSRKSLDEASKILHETKQNLTEIKKINERLNDNT